MRTLEEKWAAIVFDIVDYALQPIINVHTGAVFGFEALLRNYELVGFETAQEFFDAAYREGVLFKVELFLREKAIQKFIATGAYEKSKLFFNVDSRIIDMPDYQQGHTAKILARYGLTPHSISFEITERHRFSDLTRALQLLKVTHAQSYKITIDDFGVGYSGMQLLYGIEPDFIKIDRFFISDITKDSKKRFFVTNIVNMAHLLGILTVAEGIETEQEFYVCRDLGCDFVQGYLFQAPTTDVSQLKLKYDYVEQLSRADRRKTSNDQQLIYSKVEFIPQLSSDASVEEVFNYFLENKNSSFCPVTTPRNEPLGIVRERDLKSFAYSPYGRELLKSSGKTLKDFLVRCPIVDINTKAEQMIEIFSRENDDSEGIILVEDMQYIGFLSARSLLSIINEKNLIIARDQNPLTKLPGNTLIHTYVSEGLAAGVDHYSLIYYDFDNFKPYNDKYGFRRGDKAILLFADILKRHFDRDNHAMIGHIGGDDFFLGFKNVEFEEAYRAARAVIVEFTESVKALYDEKDRLNGYLTAKDRDGNLRQFPLLTVSAAMLEIVGEKSFCSMEEVSMILAELKKMSKSNHEKITPATVLRRTTITTISEDVEAPLPQMNA